MSQQSKYVDNPLFGPMAKRLNAAIVEMLGVKEDQIEPGDSFVDDFGADSLDTIELLMAVEEEFSIEIPDEDAEKCLTVAQAQDYLFGRLYPDKAIL